MKTLWTPERDDILKRRYENEGSVVCGNILGVKSYQAGKRARYLGLRIGKERRRQRGRENIAKMWEKNHEKLSGVDYRLFVNCSSKEVAYILGLLWADGYVLNGKTAINRIGLEILEDDFKDIRHTLRKTGRWSLTRRCRKGRRPQIIATTTNKPLAAFLKEKGYGEKNLVSACDILKEIPQELMYYWWRGFFDGDGCFYFRKYYRNRNGKSRSDIVRQMVLTGGLEQDWTFVRQLLEKLDIKYGECRQLEQKGNASSRIRITNKDGIRKFGEYIYGNFDRIGLKRKHDKWKSIIGLDNE